MLPRPPHGAEPGATVNARGPVVPLQRAVAGASPGRESTALDDFHRALPAPLRAVPMPALLAWSGIGAIGVAVFLSIAVRSPSAIEALEEAAALEPTAAVSGSASGSAASGAATATPPPTATASRAELDAAGMAGVEAIAALAQRFPEDPAVIEALFLAEARDKKSYGAAVRVARRLVDLKPDAAANDEVRRALVTIANGPTDTAVVALDLMATELGQRGAEMLFEVASGNVLLSKTKAAALLADPAVKRHATPALIIANELRASLPCARKALLARARADADARSLPYLKPLTGAACGGGGGGLRGFLGRASGNGGGECYRCFSPAERADIQGIVAAIEAQAPAP